MTSPWPTCSKQPLHILVAALLALPASAATVSGAVELTASREAGVRKGLDFSGVLVWLEGAPAAATPGARAEMVQRGKTFLPHVLPITVGTVVDFPNFDPIFHNAFSNFAGQPFDTGLYPPGTNRSVTFRRAGIVRVFCNIHPTMSAVIAVLNSRYFAVSDRKGAFRIEGVPPGEYRLRIFHERATEETLQALERKVEVGAGGLDLSKLTVSEAGYLPAPHRNKYGKDYPAAAGDHVMYPGARK